MPVREPGWWYGRAGSWQARLLTPVAWIWGTIARRRLQRAKPWRAPQTVVCVGNFTAGGTGKTPLAISIAEALGRRGAVPVFLTRGYGSQDRAPRLVESTRHTSRDVGDEALLLARHAPVMVAANRAEGARALSTSGIVADVIVMDDGLQNPHLSKDISIALIDGRRGFGNGQVIPSGPLRAPLQFQLGLVDAIVILGHGPGTEYLRQWVVARTTAMVLCAQAVADCPAGSLDGARVLAYCGIGHPDRFFDLAERAGATVEVRREFADHHVFTDVEARALLDEARSRGLQLMTTEKDLARLAGSQGVQAELAAQSRILPVSIKFDGDGLDRLVDLIVRVRTGDGG